VPVKVGMKAIQLFFWTGIYCSVLGFFLPLSTNAQSNAPRYANAFETALAFRDPVPQASSVSSAGQSGADSQSVSKVWSPDLGNGMYKNPVLYADYSDPDVIRVGEDFYLVASSFDAVPGLPILHSMDLVNWELIGHALLRQPPSDVYNVPRHGNGAWAPSIRFHDGSYFIFYPDPDYGIYMIRSSSIKGPWSTPLLIKAAPGWIDPCPFWDDDGKTYLISALAGSRKGVKGALVLSRISADGATILDEGAIVVDGHLLDPTLEGPKLYKRNGYYYIFAPGGGVTSGWQLVFRSKDLYGPYERREVLAQGTTLVNGPHQGAWVTTSAGEDWFLHFQEAGPYGRVVHLEPMRWINDWPLIGRAGKYGQPGEPVESYRKPGAKKTPIFNPADSDEFNAPTIGLQWQWQANPMPSWAFPSQALGALRLIDVPERAKGESLWKKPNLLLQKLPGPAFTATAKVSVDAHSVGDQTGLVILGQSYAYLAIKKTDQGLVVRQVESRDASFDGGEIEDATAVLHGKDVLLRATVTADAQAVFSYSEDALHFHVLGSPFRMQAGRWIGAKIGLFAMGVSNTGEYGYADYDWFRFER